VAYLTHSSYGRNGNEISFNNSSEYYTGRSAGVPGTNSMSTSAEGLYRYNTKEGETAATSGNIYGIYDLSGGAWEYTAGWDTDAEEINEHIILNGSSFASRKGESTKYATAYHNGTSNVTTSSERCILGDATYETKNWFNDYSICATSAKPFFERGGSCIDITFAIDGIFYSDYSDGENYNYGSFRIVIPGF